MTAEAEARHLGLDLGATNLKWAVVASTPSSGADARAWSTVACDQVPTRVHGDPAGVPAAVVAQLIELARAVAALRPRVPGLECMIAGRGTYLPELQSQIDIAGVGNLIEMPGFLTDEELRAAIHRAGCVVIPSLYEPFGVVAARTKPGRTWGRTGARPRSFPSRAWRARASSPWN